jgi:hypothetical protein
MWRRIMARIDPPISQPGVTAPRPEASGRNLGPPCEAGSGGWFRGCEVSFTPKVVWNPLLQADSEGPTLIG